MSSLTFYSQLYNFNIEDVLVLLFFYFSRIVFSHLCQYVLNNSHILLYRVELELNFTATWGDLHYLGLTALEVVGKDGEAVPLNMSVLSAQPRDIRHLKGHERDDRTLDKWVQEPLLVFGLILILFPKIELKILHEVNSAHELLIIWLQVDWWHMHNYVGWAHVAGTFHRRTEPHCDSDFSPRDVSIWSADLELQQNSRRYFSWGEKLFYCIIIKLVLYIKRVTKYFC